MARYHNAQVNGMNYEQYAYDYIVTQGNTDIEDIGLEMDCRFKMPWRMGEDLGRSIVKNTGGYRDQLAQQIAQAQEAARLAQMPWQEHPATERQIEYLGDLGLETVPNNITKLQASKLIDALKAQRDNEMDEDANEFVAAILA